jgi:predicted nucleic acid-binding protein
MADSVMLATSQRYGAIFWTQDAHFDGVQGVQYKKGS